jgi:hypothetical protein
MFARRAVRSVAALVLASAVAVAVFVTAGRSQQKPEAEPKAEEKKAEPKVPTVAYDVRDLVGLNAKLYPQSSVMPLPHVARAEMPVTMTGDPPGGGGGPTGLIAGFSRFYSAGERRADEFERELASLADRIKTVDPETFADGGTGLIVSGPGFLIITQTEENHRKIRDLLDRFRSLAPRPLSMTARWVLAGPDEIDGLLKTVRVMGTGTARVADAAALRALPGKPVRHAAMLEGLNGLPAHADSGRTRTVVATARPSPPLPGPFVEGKHTEPRPVPPLPSAVPAAAYLQDGISLTVTPALTPDGAAAVVEVESVFSEWRDLERGRPGESPDRPDMTVQQLHARTVIPVGKCALIGGLTLNPRSSAPPDADGRQLFLFLEIAAPPKE